MPKILLAIPPNYCYTYDFPPLGTPLLAGFLKERGIEVIQQDLNMGYLDYWKEKILQPAALSDIPTSESAPVIRELLNRVFRQKQGKGYYFSPLLIPRDERVRYGDSTNTSFYFVERLLSSEHLLRYIEDEKENTFLQYFLQEDIISYIREQNIDLVGLSIIAPSQVLGAFTLGHLIKQYLPRVHVAIGGQWVSLFRGELQKMAHGNAFFDSAIYFEGETPLYSLITALRSRKDLSSVPNLIYYSHGRWRQSGAVSREDLNHISCPDFDGLPLSDYAAAQEKGRATLTYQTARECYWNKCIYCVDLPLPKQGYRERDLDLVIADLKALKEKYSFGYMEISNAALSAAQMRGLSERILREGLDFSWWCFARMEEGFTKDLFMLAQKAGCTQIGFGLESGSQRVLDFVNKGISLEQAKRTIVECHEAGIAVNLQVMLGLPSEQLCEALETVKLLVEYNEYISDVTFNDYYITPHSQVYARPAEYGIAYQSYPDIPFKFFHSFFHRSGEVSAERVAEFMHLYRFLLQKKGGKDKQAQGEVDPAFTPGCACHELSVKVGDDAASLEYWFNQKKNEGFISGEEAVEEHALA